MPTTTTRPSTDLSLGLKGLGQLRVLRAMLALGSFTRKELAAESGQELEFVNAVVGRHKDWFEEKESVRTGRPGAREQRLVLKPEQEEGLLRLLDPLYEQAETNDEPVSAYTPTSIEFQAASDLVSLASAHGQVRPREVRRTLRLLEIASEKEGLPLAETLDGYLQQSDSSWTGAQKMAKAHVDGLRARLCLLSVREVFAEDFSKTFGFDNPISLGLGFLESSGLRFAELGAGRLVLELDVWAEQHASPALVRLLAHPNLTSKPWYSAFQTALQSAHIAKLMPRFAEPFGPRRFEIVDRNRVARAQGKERMLCTIVEMNVLAERQVRYATQRLIQRPSGNAIPVFVDDSKILDGLVSLYRRSYSPPADKVAALVNVRHQAVQVAILKGKALMCATTIAPPPAWKQRFHTTAFPHRTPFFAAGGKYVPEETSFVVGELKKTIDFFRNSPNGQKIEIVYLAGEPKVSEGIENDLRSKLGMIVEPLEFGKFLNFRLAGFSKSENDSRARRLAPEIAIAWQQCTTLTRKSLLGSVSSEELDELL